MVSFPLFLFSLFFLPSFLFSFSGNTTTLSYSKASKDPLSIAVADKLRKYLRLNDQYYQKEATTGATTSATTGATTNDHGMQGTSWSKSTTDFLQH